MKFRARAHKWTGTAKPCLGLSNINLQAGEWASFGWFQSKSQAAPANRAEGTSEPSPNDTCVSRILLFWTKKKVLWEPSEGASNSVGTKENKAGIARLRQRMRFRARAHNWTRSTKPCVWVYAFFEKRLRCSHQILRGVHDPQKVKIRCLKRGEETIARTTKNEKNVQSPGSTGVCLGKYAVEAWLEVHIHAIILSFNK